MYDSPATSGLRKDQTQMAVPKRKTGRAKTNSRRSSHSLEAPARSVCPNCSEPKMPHRVCTNCGFYDGREVVDVS